jgi:hypothetical protein
MCKKHKIGSSRNNTRCHIYVKHPVIHVPNIHGTPKAKPLKPKGTKTTTENKHLKTEQPKIPKKPKILHQKHAKKISIKDSLAITIKNIHISYTTNLS